ncbi:MAG: thiamine phosphate synthase [Campylobacterales bacterium]|nr:thiamine phosphate synthase [Campylobacterales bacterium]
MIAYAITNTSKNLQTIAKKANMVLYRDKSNPNYSNDAKIFLDKAKHYAFNKVLLHQDYRLAHQLQADGIHLTSTQLEDIPKAKALGLFVIISTHTQQEALNAQSLGANMITYSPIFDTPNKGKPIGLEALKELGNLISIPIIALGGIITQEHIKACMDNGVSGFASIRYFEIAQ